MHTKKKLFCSTRRKEIFLDIIMTGILKILYWLYCNASIFFIFTLTIFLFFPPTLPFPPVDKISFIFLIWLTIVSSFWKRDSLIYKHPINLPMIALALMATLSALMQPFKVETWSFLSSKFIIPFAMFYMAQLVFRSAQAVKYFFYFSFAVTAYLIIISIAYMVDAQVLILPQYILDPNLGIHIDRARGPFLQSVANGTAINMLGLIVLYWIQKGNFKGIFSVIFIVSWPLAIIATKTRSVWLSFVFSLILIFIMTKGKKLRRICILLVTLFSIFFIFLMSTKDVKTNLFQRLHDESPIELRLVLYNAGFEMFKERPFFGWGINQTPNYISHYMSRWDRDEGWISHNTFLDTLIEHGLVGFILYSIIIYQLFRVGIGMSRLNGRNSLLFIDHQFVSYWRIILIVYIINSMFVVMHYQFINALLFTIAGIISAEESKL